MTNGNRGSKTDTGGGAYVLGPVRTAGGDFIGRDQINNYHIDVKVIQATASLNRFARPLQGEIQPYLPDRPFRTEDHLLFTGRDTEIEFIKNLLKDDQAQTSVIYGPADVGKTSLLTAGVIPTMDEDAVVIHLRDYAYPVPFIRAALIGRAKQLGLSIPENASIREFSERIVSVSSGRILLVLDQFERYFLSRGNKTEWEALQHELFETSQNISPHHFRILIAVRNDMQAELDRLWGDLLSGLRYSPLHLQPLGSLQAKAAIEHPLDILNYPASFSDDVVDAWLLPDLGKINEQNDKILPADLQIVCNTLYEASQKQRPPHITTDLYLEISNQKGAEQILDLHFKRLLSRVPVEQQQSVQEISKTIVSYMDQFWATSEDLSTAGVKASNIEETLETMVEAGLLIWHLDGQEKAYAFASKSIANAATREFGRAAYQAHQARNELNYIWRAWIAYDALAKKDQLWFVQNRYTQRPIPTEKALLLLHSAVVQNLSSAYWLSQLDTKSSRELINQLDQQPYTKLAKSQKSTPQNHIRLLFGLFDETLPQQPPNTDFGQITWAAIAHPNAAHRETAILAKMIGEKKNILDHIERSVQAASARTSRLIELRGILADADEEIEAEVQKKPALDRFGTWLWRVRRRFIRELPYIGSLAFGAGIGAGLGLGLLRALLACLIDEGSGFYFYSYFPSGFISGFGLALGLLLVNVLRLKTPEYEPDKVVQRPFLPAVILSTLGFAFVQLLLISTMRISTFVTAPLIPILSLLAGLGVGIAVYDQPLAGWHIGVKRWITRLFAAAASFTLSQLIFILAKDYGESLVFGWGGEFLRPRLRDNIYRWGLDSILSINNWFHYAAIIDAALTGIVLAVGITAGLVLAVGIYSQWRTYANRLASEGDA